MSTEKGTYVAAQVSNAELIGVVESEGNPFDAVWRVLNLLVRRRWWILVTAATVSLLAIGWVSRMPNRYKSEATLVITEQQVSQRFVDPVTTAVDPITTAERRILSRSRLLGIIDELDLYPKERSRFTANELADHMREKDLAIDRRDPTPGRTNEFRAFTITFTADSPQLAQAVTSRLTSLFIEESSRDRSDRATNTTTFLTERLEVAKRKLDEQERRVQDFKTRNAGDLSEQQQLNLAAATGLRVELQTTVTSLNRARQQRASLENIVVGSLSSLQNQRNALLTKFTPRHAEVIKKDQEIAKVTRLLEALRSDSPLPGTLEALAGEDLAVVQLKSQLEANTDEIASLTRDEQRLRAEMKSYQERMSSMPVRELQLAGLVRDYDLYKRDYSDLLEKQQKAQLTVNMEERQQGEQFRLVDPPTLPTLPSGPKRLQMTAGGIVAGLVLGLVCAACIDFRKRTFYDEREINSHYEMPLVVSIPVLLTPREGRKRIWKQAMEWVAASLLIAAVALAEYYVYTGASRT